MAGATKVFVRLFGPFAIEAKGARAIPLPVASRRGRALIAYLAMQPRYRANREHLATLLWGDSGDVQARQSLRQCIASLRRDLHRGPDLLVVDRDSVGLLGQNLIVDTREFTALGNSSQERDLQRAATLFQGEFLADLSIDVEEFDAWRQSEGIKFAEIAARVFEILSHNADERHDADAAIAAAERLVALDPTREDWQRAALRLMARYRGREAALSRAKKCVDMLKHELGVTPETETRSLVGAIRRGEIETVAGAETRQPESVVDASRSVYAMSTEHSGDLAAPAAPPVRESRSGLSARLPFLQSAAIPTHLVAAILIVVSAALALFYLATVSPFQSAVLEQESSPANPATAATAPFEGATTPAAVLPFKVNDGNPGDNAIAQMVTHDLIGYLARYPQLRVVSAQTSDLYRDRPAALSAIGAELGVPYVIDGRILGGDKGLRVTFKLVETQSRLNLWSDEVQRERGEPAMLADEVARGISRALQNQITYARAKRSRYAGAIAVSDLIERGRAAEQLGPWRENLSEALRLFEQALQRDPDSIPARIGVARVHVIAAGTLVDLDPAVDLGRAERLLDEVLAKDPNRPTAQYNRGLLLKVRHQYQAAIQSFQRALELNPSFVFGNAQIGQIISRLGDPREGLERIQYFMRLGSKDPAMGYGYLFAGEAELDLGHPKAALEWMLRANGYFPGSALVHAWLAAVYAIIGDETNSASHVAAFRRLSPRTAQQIMNRPAGDPVGDGLPPSPIYKGLWQALQVTRG
jgi:DNA-binding SARP family transcriptional activator/TolB-like protein